MSTIHILEPSPVGGVGATGALILAEALRAAGHTVVRATVGREEQVQVSLLPSEERKADVRSLPRPDAWFVSCLYPRQWVYLPRMFEALGIDPIAARRGNDVPLVAFGGQSQIAPLPIERFADVLALGDGEVTGVAIANAIGSNKQETLRGLAGVRGLAVPSVSGSRCALVRAETSEIGVRLIRPGDNGHPTIELARGCKSKCTFCSIGWAGGTYREAPQEQVQAKLVQLGRRSVSLFAPDYSSVSWVDELEAVVESVGCSPKQKDARLDAAHRHLKHGQGVRSYSFGIEGASERLRAAIGKPLAHDKIVETMRLLGSGGVELIRWYMILALPGEDQRDYLEFHRLLDDVAEVYAGRLDITLTHFQSVPQTPMERCANFYDHTAAAAAEAITQKVKGWWQDGKRQWLASNFKGRETHEHDVFLQRADERAADYLLRLAGKESRIQSGKWREDAAACGLDVDAIVGEQRDPLPWAHIDTGVPSSRREAAWISYGKRLEHRSQ